jgi:hypothetical protein
MDVVDANPRQTCNFRIGEDLLARLYGNHGLAPEPRLLLSASLLIQHNRLMLVAG